MSTMQTVVAVQAQRVLTDHPYGVTLLNKWVSEAPGAEWAAVGASVVQHGDKLTVYHTYQRPDDPPMEEE
jgi:hypothetical protein